jgi:SAM-dependent methyltransferase
LTDRGRFYDTIAGDFDEIMNGYDLGRRLEVVYDDLLGDVDLSGRRVLDAGCGTGFFSARARAAGAEVVSLDIGVNLLRMARKKGLTRLAAADLLAAPFPDAAFDVVVSSECIEHTPFPPAAVAELARVLKPGGLLALTCPNRFWHWSCVVAGVLGVRPYQGFENWPGWWSLERWLRAGGVSVRRHLGLHLFPFVLTPTHPLLRRLDRAGNLAGPLFVNQCVLGVKHSGDQGGPPRP